MLRPSRATTLRLVESCYAVFALFALTQGPVYRIWAASSSFLQASPQTSMQHVYFATFVAAQLPAVFLLGYQVKPSLLFDRATNVLLALLLWFGLTVLWSTLARHALPEYVALVMTTCFGVYLSTRFSVDEIWRIIASAMTIGLGFSLFAIWRNWDAAVNEENGHWIGMYYNRNSLAPVAAVAAIASIGLIISGMRSRKMFSPSIWQGIGLIVLSFVVLWKAQSQTSPFALAVAACTLVVWSALRWVTRVRALRASWWSVTTATLLTVGIGLFLAMRTIGNLSIVSDETATFNSREALWSQSWAAVQLKPWHGWGWQAAWYTPDFFWQASWEVFYTKWSHNGYHDLLLGGGFIAGGLFIAYIALVARHMDKCPVSTSTPMLLMAVFVLAAATQESFFIGSHFLWALLISSFTVCIRKSVDSVEQQNTSKLPA